MLGVIDSRYYNLPAARCLLSLQEADVRDSKKLFQKSLRRAEYQLRQESGNAKAEQCSVTSRSLD